MVVLIALMAIGFTSCNDDDTTVVEDNSIAGIASRNSNLTSLVAALNKAGLTSTLQNTGPYTVFAPTNAAFSTFLQANGYANLDAVPVAALKEILLNHVVNGAAQSTNLTNNYLVLVFSFCATFPTDRLLVPFFFLRHLHR